MNASRNAVATGVRRGLIEFRNSLRTPSEVSYYVIGAAIFVVVMVLNRDTTIDQLPVMLFVFPGVLAMQVVLTSTYGLATALATEREDGTLLRAKSLPHGMAGYVTGQATRTFLEFAFSAAILTVAASILIAGLWGNGPVGVLGMIGYVVLGLLAAVPLGMVIGSVFKNPRSIGGWGFFVFAGLLAVSGVFFPLQALPGWLQVIGQVFPVYWLGLGLRSALLPAEAVAIEIGESWRTLETLGVLGVWAVVGLLLAPVLLRRMARRESGSTVEARRQSALQRV